jgi:hypothetical protein
MSTERTWVGDNKTDGIIFLNYYTNYILNNIYKPFSR